MVYLNEDEEGAQFEHMPTNVLHDSEDDESLADLTTSLPSQRPEETKAMRTRGSEAQKRRKAVLPSSDEEKEGSENLELSSDDEFNTIPVVVSPRRRSARVALVKENDTKKKGTGRRKKRDEEEEAHEDQQSTEEEEYEHEQEEEDDDEGQDEKSEDEGSPTGDNTEEEEQKEDDEALGGIEGEPHRDNTAVSACHTEDELQRSGALQTTNNLKVQNQMEGISSQEYQATRGKQCESNTTIPAPALLQPKKKRGLSRRARVPSLHNHLKPLPPPKPSLPKEKKRGKEDEEYSDEEKPWYETKDPEEWDDDDREAYSKILRRREMGLD